MQKHFINTNGMFSTTITLWFVICALSKIIGMPYKAYAFTLKWMDACSINKKTLLEFKVG
jgi:hypothetical protein